jgi:hypothetical protein
MQLVTVQDNTKNGLDSTLFSKWVRALNYQAKWHYGYSPWVFKSYAQPAEVKPLAKGAAVPVGAWNIELLDVSDVEGALGYHEDIFASSKHSVRAMEENVPYSKVFVQTAQADNIDPCEVASHEMLEMLVDPYVANEGQVYKVLNKTAKEWYIVEVGDPVQGCGYDISAPQGGHFGVTVADFAWPKWFGLDQSRPYMSYRHSVTQAYELAPEGYMSVAPESEPSNWTQIFGSAKGKAEAADHAYEHGNDAS